MAKLFFDDIAELLGIGKPKDYQEPVQADDPLGTSDPQFGYRDYTPVERAQEVLYGSLDTAGSMLRGMGKAAIEAPRDIYALGSAIGKIQDRSRNRVEGQPVKTIGELFTEAYNEAPSFLPDEATAERALPEMTPMSRTYSQDASVYNLPEEFGRIAAPLPLLDYARPAQIARMGKTPRILEEGLLTDEAVSALGRIPAGMSVKPVDDSGTFRNFTEEAVGRLETNPMSREVVIEMPIRDYLKFAREANPEAPENIEKAAGVSGVEKFDDIPFLSIDEVKDGVAKVTGHEGRHRAKELLARGETTMPVRIRSTNIRWGQQTKPDSYDYKQDFPTQLVGEEGSAALREGSTMPFPVQRGDYGIVRKEQPTPRILDARDPITGRTGFGTTRQDIPPALEPLREPTMAARYLHEDYDRTVQMWRNDTMSYDDLLAEANSSDAADQLRARATRAVNDRLPQGTDVDTLIESGRMDKLINDQIVEFMRGSKAMGVQKRYDPRSSTILPEQDPTPAILRDTPKVEKEPPMLREPIEKTGNYPATGTYSRLHQALLDIKNDPKVPASMTPRDLSRRLDAMGVTKADLEEHGLNLADYTRMNANGNQVVDIQTIADNVYPPQDRMDRIILEGGKDAEEMNLEQNQDLFRTQDYEEYTGYDSEGDIENGLSDVAYSISRQDFAGWSDQAKDVHQILKNKYISEGMTPSDAQMSAIDIMVRAENEGSDNWLDWLTDPVRNNGEYDYRLEEQVRDAMEERARESYEQAPVFDDTITFAGEQYSFVGNDDIGYRVFDGQGNQIANDIYSLNEVEVQIQNDAINAGAYGYGGEGSMKWTTYLQGDSNYYKPLEEVILTYNPKTGDTFESSHYGSDVADGYVAHLRATSRETADGDSVYHVDEIQSDLHQEGRQGGYKQEGAEKAVKAARKALGETNNRLIRYENEFINGSEDLWRESNRKMYEVITDGESEQILDEIRGTNLDQNSVYYDKTIATNIAHGRRAGASDYQKKAGKRAEEALKDADPRYKKLIEMRIEEADRKYDLSEAKENLSKPSGEYPLKDERWIKAMVRQAMERAVAKGNFNGITFSNPQNQINQWSNRYEKLYNEVYGNKLKSILETIGKEYGVKPRKIKLNDPEMQEAGENWYLPLSKDMMETIKKRGVPLASAVGATPAILDRINKEREDKTPRILRTA